MTLALLGVWERGRTRHPLVRDIFMARAINQFLGTALGPWDFEQLDAATLEALKQISYGPPPGLQAGLARIEQAKAEIRRQVLH